MITMIFLSLCVRPDGQKKAYVRLAPDYDALDVANKVSGFVNNINGKCRVFVAYCLLGISYYAFLLSE